MIGSNFLNAWVFYFQIRVSFFFKKAVKLQMFLCKVTWIYLNLQASELTVNDCTLYIVYAFPGNQPMTLVFKVQV